MQTRIKKKIPAPTLPPRFRSNKAMIAAAFQKMRPGESGSGLPNEVWPATHGRAIDQSLAGKDADGTAELTG